MPFLEHLIGHSKVKKVLERMLTEDRLPHALLLVGPRNVGKTLLAEMLIKALFKTERSLEMIADLTVVKREFDQKTKKHKSQISVKQIRQLCERLAMSSLDGSWKVAFIAEADHLSIGAANALLKTLEEPKGKTLIILRAPATESVLPTVASRCQVLRLTPMPRAELVTALEKRGLSKQEAIDLAVRSYGRPGLALRYINDSELRAQKQTAQEQATRLFQASLPEQFKSVFELIPKAEEDKARVLHRLIDDWAEVLRDQMLKSIGSGEVEKTSRVLKRMQEVREALRHNVNPHLALEHIFLACH